jgi:hypothetical protein
MNEVICKGAMALNSNCGKCSKCYGEAISQLAALREELADLKSSVSTWRIAYDRRTSECDELKQLLADAERRKRS